MFWTLKKTGQVVAGVFVCEWPHEALRLSDQAGEKLK